MNGQRGNIRFGLCCIFRREPIKFRQVTAKTLLKLSQKERYSRLAEVCLHNVLSLQKALHYAAGKKIGAFRILSPLFPRYTHPEVGYSLEDLPAQKEINNVFSAIRRFRKQQDIRLSFHPDQFNVLSSPRPDVVEKTIRELEYQAMLAKLAGADVINIHAGGAYGDKSQALKRLHTNLRNIPKPVFRLLSLENDDRSYSPGDLLPLCEELQIPMVYDVHHHRCLPDGMSEAKVTERVVKLWESLGKEPYFHISSPKNGWQGEDSRPHADYIDPEDFPPCWLDLTATVDVEAKAKELAVLKLMKDLTGR